MAQLVERLVRNEEASGSNPLISTNIKKRPFLAVLTLKYGRFCLYLCVFLCKMLLKIVTFFE